MIQSVVIVPLKSIEYSNTKEHLGSQSENEYSDDNDYLVCFFKGGA